jgi:hypothetical protein
MPFARCALTLALLLQPSALSAQVTCRPASERSAEVQRYLVFLATSPDSEAIHTREQTGLPMTAAHTVAPITDATKCAEAGAAINAIVHEPKRNQALWLFSYGTGYAALTPDMPYYDGTPLFLFDRNWEQIFATGFYNFSGPSRE